MPPVGRLALKPPYFEPHSAHADGGLKASRPIVGDYIPLTFLFNRMIDVKEISSVILDGGLEFSVG